MPRARPFEEHLDEYEHWFVRNHFAYLSELAALKKAVPATGCGVEIGVGSGQFAVPLGIRDGVDPSPAMRTKASGRGVRVVSGVAENLPYGDERFDYALMVTVLCFLDDVPLAFHEARRVLKPHGALIIGFIDKESPLGKATLQRRHDSVFYRQAVFFSTIEVQNLLSRAGFAVEATWQTVFGTPGDMRTVQRTRKGHGQGGFVVVRALKHGPVGSPIPGRKTTVC
jgi:SAM-dependent methyltransferase